MIRRRLGDAIFVDWKPSLLGGMGNVAGRGRSCRICLVVDAGPGSGFCDQLDLGLASSGERAGLLEVGPM